MLVSVWRKGAIIFFVLNFIAVTEVDLHHWVWFINR